MALLLSGNQGRGSLLFDGATQPSALSQQAALQHQQSISRDQARQGQPAGSSTPNIPSGLLDQFTGSGAATGVGTAAGTSGTGSVGYGLGQPLVSGGIGSASYAAPAASTGGAAAGSGAAGTGGASALGAAGPWAALAAAILLNENYQKKSGNRDQGTGKQIEHAFTGKVVEDDASVWGEKIDSGNKLGIKGDMEVGADFATFDFSNAFKNIDETFGIKTLKNLF